MFYKPDIPVPPHSNPPTLPRSFHIYGYLFACNYRYIQSIIIQYSHSVITAMLFAFHYTTFTGKKYSVINMVF